MKSAKLRLFKIMHRSKRGKDRRWKTEQGIKSCARYPSKESAQLHLKWTEENVPSYAKKNEFRIRMTPKSEWYFTHGTDCPVCGHLLINQELSDGN